MIKCDSDRIVRCATCGRDAICRQREVRHPNTGARYLDFDSHWEETDPRFVEMMTRVDTFHERLHELQMEIKRACLSDRNLPITFTDAELESIKPTACLVRTTIIPTALVTAFGKQAEIRLPARELAEATAIAIIDELKAAAMNELENLRARFEQGRP